MLSEIPECDLFMVTVLWHRMPSDPIREGSYRVEAKNISHAIRKTENVFDPDSEGRCTVVHIVAVSEQRLPDSIEDLVADELD